MKRASSQPLVTRREIARRLVSVGNDLSVHQAEAVVGDALDLIAAAVADGERVFLKSFGIFSKTSIKAHGIINPSTGETIQLPERGKVRFQPSATFKRAVA